MGGEGRHQWHLISPPPTRYAQRNEFFCYIQHDEIKYHHYAKKCFIYSLITPIRLTAQSYPGLTVADLTTFGTKAVLELPAQMATATHRHPNVTGRLVIGEVWHG